MTPFTIFLVSAIVLVSVKLCDSHRRKTIMCASCDCFLDEADLLNLNCSRRNLDEIENEWFDNVTAFSHDGSVALTYYNNNVTLLKQLPHIPGDKVAVSLNSNEIRDIEDSAFRNIKHIYFLDLRKNFLTGDAMRSEIFEGPFTEMDYEPIDLQILYLSYNQIHSLDRRLFEHTPNLTQLYLNNNPIEILDSVTMLALSSAVNLEILDLSYIEIDSIPLDTFRQLVKLQVLDVSGNKFLEVPPSIGILTNLQILKFNNNPITELDEDSFRGLSNLKGLEVKNNEELADINSSTFSPLLSLISLALSNNTKLRYISRHAFRNIRTSWNIKEVYLNDNNLSELPIDLMPWDRLNRLDLSGNNWLCNCALGNIIIKQGAAKILEKDDLPTCISPMKLSGTYLTDIPMDRCSDVANNSGKGPRGFILSKLKPKHILWTIFGVLLVVLLGMLLGLLLNYNRLLQSTHSSEPIRYININTNNFII